MNEYFLFWVHTQPVIPPKTPPGSKGIEAVFEAWKKKIPQTSGTKSRASVIFHSEKAILVDIYQFSCFYYQEHSTKPWVFLFYLMHSKLLAFIMPHT